MRDCAAAGAGAFAGVGDSAGVGPGAVLLSRTPPAWADAAAERWQELLLDHANCEKKAASNALSLMFAYPLDRPLCAALSRLAREELRHFEQVQRMIEALGVPARRLTPGRYGAGLRSFLRSAEPGRKLDLLLAAALIEARSCERFELLAPRLTAPLAELYAGLARSEARHFERYLEFARRQSEDTWRARLGELAVHEARLATQPDGELRFHSGTPTWRVPVPGREPPGGAPGRDPPGTAIG